MPTKGELTRQRVIEQAAPVFNQRGYWGSSLRDLMDATGLNKGGIYNHFRSKDELAEAAFDHNVDLMRQQIRAALEGRRHAVQRLKAINDVYRAFVSNPPFVGGCPIMNLAVESDDTHPKLRRKAQRAMRELRDDTLVRIVARGVERGELRPDVDPEATGTLIVSSLEGALMLSHLYGDPSFVERVADHFDQYAESLATKETK
jgi:TetR/AcrR family transcriptional repressor of nem operon